MRAGLLRTQAQLQQATDVDDGQGGKTKTWATIATIHMDLRAGAGREFATALQTRPMLTHTGTIRYRAGITAAMRLVVDGTRVIQIYSVADPDGRRRELTLMLGELVGETVT